MDNVAKRFYSLITYGVPVQRPLPHDSLPAPPPFFFDGVDRSTDGKSGVVSDFAVIMSDTL